MLKALQLQLILMILTATPATQLHLTLAPMNLTAVVPSGTIAYSGTPYSSNAGSANVTQTATAGGTFTAAPAALTINAATGAVTLGTSTPGAYDGYLYGCRCRQLPVIYHNRSNYYYTGSSCNDCINTASPYCLSGGTATVTQTGSSRRNLFGCTGWFKY